MKGLAAMTLGLAAVGCSHEIGGEGDLRAKIVAEYNEMFVKIFGQPAPDQDWGFGTSGTRAAVAPWNTTHTHAWETGLEIDSEAELIAKGAVRIDTTTNVAWTDDNGTPVYYIPKADILYVSHNHKGELRLNDNFEKTCSFYNYGNITKIGVNSANADVTFYNAGTLVNTYGARDKQVVYNTGTFIIDNNDMYAKISKLYNSGNLELGGGSYTDNNGDTVYYQANIKTNIAIYSTGTGLVELPGGADWMAECHIDGIVYTDAYLKIQNSTDKYMCGVVSRNEGDNIDIVDKAGGLTTSYIKTNTLTLNGASVYLTNNGYVNANQIHVEGSSCNSQPGSEYEAIVVEPVTGAKAFVETTSYDLPNVKIFGNHLGAGVYTKFETITYYAEGYENSVVTKTAEEYFTRKPGEAGKLAPETLGGVSECGGEWGNKTTTTTPADEFVFQHRVFAEDLTSSEDGSDLDFNDVVFDLLYNAYTDQTQVLLQAAGGTLPLYIITGETETEVHEAFKVPTKTMVNTGTLTGASTTDKDPVVIDYLDGQVQPGEIIIKVKKDGSDEPIEITAYTGKPAAKFAVTEPIDWASERQQFKNKYPKFEEWVKYPSVVWY